MIYFIQAGAADGPVKIGTTRNLAQRIASIASAHFEPISVLATIEGGAIIEGKFHQLLETYRIRGEWFRWCPEVRAVVNLAKAGKFPEFPAAPKKPTRNAAPPPLPEFDASDVAQIPHPDGLRARLEASGIGDGEAMALLKAMGAKVARRTLYNFRHNRGEPTFSTVVTVAAMLDFAAKRASSDAA